VRRRGTTAPSSLTSLLDVLFILVFAALVRTASLREAAGEPAAPAAAVTPPPKPAAPAATDPRADLRRRALARLEASLHARQVIIVRIAGDGTVTAVEEGTRQLTPSIPLVARVGDPDVGQSYLGDASPDLRVCAIARRELGRRDLGDALVIVAPAVPLSAMTVARVEGRRRDEQRCTGDQNGLAVLLEPPPGGPPAPADAAAPAPGAPR